MPATSTRSPSPRSAARESRCVCSNRKTERWTIHWADSRTGRLDPPLVGGFADDRGDFHGEDTYDGRPIRVHFTWYRLGTDTARWEQEFSADDGRTWELNWTMNLTRTGDAGA